MTPQDERGSPRPGFFRDEALSYHTASRAEGDVLRLPPTWVRWAYPFALLSLVAMVGFMWFFRARQFAEGPAVVRVDGRVDVTAPGVGTISGIEISAGQRVEAGDVVATMELPGGPSSVVAPVAGEVYAVRVRAGAAARRGDVLVSLATSSRRSIVALLPARAREHVERGGELRWTPDDPAAKNLALRIDHVGATILGSSEARRDLPPEIADEVEIEGPVVLVAAVPVEDVGALDALAEGTLGTAQVPLASERLLHVLVPALKRRTGS